jgi:gamma-glutamyl-gamma-aminobutyraldehyde dehydrogenase
VSEFTLEQWTAYSSSLQFRTNAFIDGAFVPARSGATFTSVNPATGKTLAHVASCDEHDVDVAVRSARRAFDRGTWSRAGMAQRQAVLKRLSALIIENAEELALLDSLDMGKLVRECSAVDVPGTAALFSWYGDAIDKIGDEVAPSEPGNLALVTREPLGVVGAVVPWNYPLEMAAWKLAPALAVGNSVVLKPAEQSSLSALLLAELASEAGLPDGVLNVVPGLGHSAGRALGLHDDVDCITFTGSGEVGKFFLEYAGQSNMKQVWLECGGKSPNLVFADADLQAAAAKACFGIFYNQGEVCSANSRLLVEASVKDEFLERIVAEAAHYQPGNPLDPASGMGALVSAEHLERVMGFVERARADATLVIGGEPVLSETGGAFLAPTIFDEVVPGSELAVDEVFGPVLAVTTFHTEDEALSLANATRFGLAASLWTNDLSRAHRVAERLRAGTVSVNTVDALSFQTPFGGFGQSGFGRDLSLHATDKYVGLKTTWISYNNG